MGAVSTRLVLRALPEGLLDHLLQKRRQLVQQVLQLEGRIHVRAMCMRGVCACVGRDKSSRGPQIQPDSLEQQLCRGICKARQICIRE